MVKQDAQMNIKLSSGMKQGLEKAADLQGIGLTSLMKYAAFLILNNMDDDELTIKFKRAMIEYNRVEQKIYQEVEGEMLEAVKGMHESGFDNAVEQFIASSEKLTQKAQ
jgi:ABC-type phosphate/phosphonate transport system substrate-binding protein